MPVIYTVNVPTATANVPAKITTERLPMKIDISPENTETFLRAIEFGYCNANWIGDELNFTFTEKGHNFLLAALQEAGNVPDDPLHLQTQVNMWQERALRAEAELHAWTQPLASTDVHNHDLDPSCTESQNGGRLMGACMTQRRKEGTDE